MKTSHLVISGATFLLIAVACGSGSPDPITSRPETVMVPAPVEPAAPPTASGSARQVFDDGHYALTVPGTLTFHEGSSEGVKSFGAEVTAGFTRLTVLYTLSEYADPTATTDMGLHAYVLSAELGAAGGRETDRQTHDLRGPGVSATVVTWVETHAAGGEVHHISAVFAPDPHATFTLQAARSGAPVDASWFAGILDSFEIVKAREVVQLPEDAAVIDLKSEAPIATAAEVAATPRSEKPGEAGVASSCNMIGLNRQCYETAAAAVESGFYGNRERCGNSMDSGVLFGDAPCPEAGRIGACVLSGGKQVAHLYERGTWTWEPGQAQSMCEGSWSGHWVAKTSRPWPVNPP